MIKLKKLTKDCCTHWFHNPTEKIFTLNKENKWIKGNYHLYDIYEDEIDEIKEVKNKQKKLIKSTKLTKSTKLDKSTKNKEVKETKEKKNKSTKSNVVVSYYDSDDDLDTNLDELDRKK